MGRLKYFKTYGGVPKYVITDTDVSGDSEFSEQEPGDVSRYSFVPSDDERSLVRYLLLLAADATSDRPHRVTLARGGITVTWIPPRLPAAE
jgi:hypothetical protein